MVHTKLPVLSDAGHICLMWPTQCAQKLPLHVMCVSVTLENSNVNSTQMCYADPTCYTVLKGLTSSISEVWTLPL